MKPNIPVRTGYQVPYTTVMKEAVSIPVSVVGLLIRNVNWLADAAEELRDTNFEVYNHSYQRGQSR